MDIYQHVCRYWNNKADRLTHVAKENGLVWNSSETKEKIEAIQTCFDGGVSDKHDKQVKSRSGAGWIIKTAECIQNEMEWGMKVTRLATRASNTQPSWKMNSCALTDKC